MVLMWSFRARDAGLGLQGNPPTYQEHRWGGITLFHFDESGRIEAEIGEESTPGPVGRLAKGV